MKYLIAVDGLDGSGKDSHSLRIQEALEQHGDTVIVLRHPSNRVFGRMSKRAMQKSGSAAMAVAAVFYTLDVLVSVREYKRLRSGRVVFVRYLLGTAYLPRRMAHRTYTLFRRLLPFPDLPLFIDVEPAVAIHRIEIRDHVREMFETEGQLSQIRAVALSIAKGEWIIVNNSEDGESPFEQVREILRSRGLISDAHTEPSVTRFTNTS